MPSGQKMEASLTENDEVDARAGVVDFFFQQSIMTSRGRVVVVMACVDWLQLHPNCHLLGLPVELWCHQQYEPFGPGSYIPVNRIKSICCSSKFLNDDGETLLATISLHHTDNSI